MGLKLDNISTFWLILENSKCYDEIATYTIEITVRDQITPKVKDTKAK